MSEESEEEAAEPMSPRGAVAVVGVSADNTEPKRRVLYITALVFGAFLVLMLLLVLFSSTWHYQAPMEKKRTLALLAEIEGGLDNYKIDHGTYPINPAENREDAAIEGARVLYQHLSGDFDMDGEFDAHDPDAKIYVDSLDFQSSTKANKGTVVVSPGGHYIATDSYGNPIRYLCDPPNRISGGNVEKRTLNPTYDFWSTGGASPDDDSEKARAKWITNWGAQ